MYQYYKARIYPNAEQREFFAKSFGCVRFVWNYMLDRSTKVYNRRGEHLSRFDMDAELKNLKKWYPWLKVPDDGALQITNENLSNAFNRFFRGQNNYPKFKSKKNPVMSYTSKSRAIYYKDGYLKLPKIDWIKIHNKRLPPEDIKIKRVTVSLNPAGEYHVSILVEEPASPLPVIDKAIGIDMGINNFLTDSDGNIVKNPLCFGEIMDKLAKEKRALCRKQYGSRNYEKQRIRVAKIYAKITRQREHFQNCLVKKLIDENQVICVENLDINKMIKSVGDLSNSSKHNVRRVIYDSSWASFITKLENKAAYTGREVVKIPTHYPSSQTCHCCGSINPKTKNPKLKTWTCPVCGAVHDRDYNAAINILNKGISIVGSV